MAIINESFPEFLREFDEVRLNGSTLLLLKQINKNVLAHAHTCWMHGELMGGLILKESSGNC